MTANSEFSPATRFDVRGFARTANGSHRDAIDLSDFESNRLSSDSLHAVSYLARLEGSTMEHLRNLLVTATHKDARVTAFLVTWAFEKFWIADALDQVLLANGRPTSHDEPDEGKRRMTRSEARERRGPIRRAILAIQQGVPIIAVHTTTGLIDEWITRVAYERLSAIAASPALAAIITRLLAVKQRHADFFEDESRRRLAESASAVKQTRASITHQAWPLGAIDRSAADRSFFESFAFGGGEGLDRAAEIAAKISSLPGLDPQIAGTVARKLLP
jgi:hypothetical protein